MHETRGYKHMNVSSQSEGRCYQPALEPLNSKTPCSQVEFCHTPPPARLPSAIGHWLSAIGYTVCGRASPTCTARLCRWACLLSLVVAAQLRAEVTFSSPGLPPTRMDDQGRLVEDWGTISVNVTGTGLPSATPATLNSIKLDSIVPAAQAQFQYGAVVLTLTAFRAPVWPAGLDVLTVHLKETAGQETPVQLSLALPENVRLGLKTVTLGGRAVLSLPAGTKVSQAMRDWGWADDAVAIPGWARPAVDCDPAFRNIRAGMGGVPILYHFKVDPKAHAQVVLGFCESFWAQAGQRPVICQVEGAPTQEVDPLARWGQHHPGVILFPASDANGDGTLDVSIFPKPDAPDQNPILNAIWLFPPGATPNPEQVIAGKLNAVALRYVAVGGSNDQSLYAGGRVEYALKLPANSTQELTFLVACPGGSVPPPDQTTWSPEKLRQSAVAVWRDWR
jgi:hypothetical protein